MNAQRTYIVHKDNEEGTIQVEHLTGKILTPLADKPDWAQGLASAIPAERTMFYERRLGREGAAEILSADAVNFADLCWVGMNAGEPEEIAADPTYRSELVAKLTGTDADGKTEGATIERELAMENSRRTPEEQAAIDKAVHDGFRTEEAQRTTATGTK